MGKSVYFAASVALAFALCHCASSSSDAPPELDIPSPVAVGATVTVKQKCAGAACASLELDQARVEDASVFRILDAPPSAQVASLRLEALRAGTTLFRVRVDDGSSVRTVERSVRAAVPDKLTFAVPACSAPLLFGTDHTFTLGVSRFVGSTPLQGVGGTYPIAAEGAQASDPSGLTFKTSSQPTKGSIRSLVNPAAVPFEVYALANVTSMTLQSATKPLKIGVPFVVESKLLVGGDPLCADSFARDVTSEAPSICDVVSVRGSAIEVLGRRSGTCIVKATLSGSRVEAQSSFTIQN